MLYQAYVPGFPTDFNPELGEDEHITLEMRCSTTCLSVINRWRNTSRGDFSSGKIRAGCLRDFVKFMKKGGMNVHLYTLPESKLLNHFRDQRAAMKCHASL